MRTRLVLLAGMTAAILADVRQRPATVSPTNAAIPEMPKQTTRTGKRGTAS